VKIPLAVGSTTAFGPTHLTDGCTRVGLHVAVPHKTCDPGWATRFLASLAKAGRGDECTFQHPSARIL